MTLSVLTFNTCSRTLTFQSSSYFNELAARRTRFVAARLLPLPVLETGANYELTEKEEPPTATGHTGAETGRLGAELGPRISGRVRAGAGSPTVTPPAVGRSVPEGGVMTTTINHPHCVCHLVGLLSAREWHDGSCSSWLWRDLWYHARYFLTGNKARTKTGRRKFLLCSVVRCGGQ